MYFFSLSFGFRYALHIYEGHVDSFGDVALPRNLYTLSIVKCFVTAQTMQHSIIHALFVYVVDGWMDVVSLTSKKWTRNRTRGTKAPEGKAWFESIGHIESIKKM